MAFLSVNPATGEEFFRAEGHEPEQVEAILDEASRAAPDWRDQPVAERAELLRRVSRLLHARRDELANLATLEMGKLKAEAHAEIEKCAAACDYYAEHAADFLADERIATDAADSRVVYQPLGTVLAVMPWNFPFWQAIRCAAPALAAGNTVLLKHASSVPQCALAIDQVFAEAGCPEGVFRTLLIGSDAVEMVIADPRVHAVSLTGSDKAGAAVAAVAGEHLKKCVLELGGSDAFIVLADADLDAAVAQGLKSRFQNAGQSCIAAKRFLLHADIADAFLERFVAGAEALVPGDPAAEDTTLGPMARTDLRDELDAQVEDAVEHGARVLTGGRPLEGPGAFYAPTVLDGVTPVMRAWSEELFGPVATVMRVEDAEHALVIANGSPFGLGGAVWTQDLERGAALARRLECGAAFVNGMVKSDPRLPFGGVKDSGYGRELSRHGLLEFVNAKTLWVG
ncbi:NAD-dependent succinate-semialdehyde dehydrogenase [Thioalkalivibrio sp. XN279]|uniref:NAD-dependent succinate-semialdehyde dehydrogenase n=1 Tax=Thioalkalivibrio sp. XN279 TaxID=2714953 RepID=UPI00140BFBBD|nr:NAD-dependent succinate-semialdehyde dehydrogenase [Thioalkalivibrio sp. XN279]NHA14037.1 NAD-dependent succinate-semialdehyde dehydrogenase [Thioalkalivibrio sp. XN279]